MTTRSLILSPHEVRAALDGRLGLVVRPVSLRHVHDIEEDGTPMRECKDGVWREAKCPLGVPGDRLRCREAWGEVVKASTTGGGDIVENGRVVYRETSPNAQVDQRWRSPATMPAWASRITLEVVGVGCVRVQELCIGKWFESMAKETWDAKYSTRYPWDANPWVWGVEVRRVEG